MGEGRASIILKRFNIYIKKIIVGSSAVDRGGGVGGVEGRGLDDVGGNNTMPCVQPRSLPMISWRYTRWRSSIH